jgi:hypothetical protein
LPFLTTYKKKLKDVEIGSYSSKSIPSAKHGLKKVKHNVNNFFEKDRTEKK